MRAHLDIKHEGSLGSDDRVRFQFDADSTAFLMSTLIDLYSDKELAVIREYSTNALDSHKAAGNPAPIEITLPTSLNPVFKVTDHGVGLSVDEITQHLSKYGWSSKRDTDDAVGMLGLGFKAGLTYTSQFTVIAVKNGVKVITLVTRDPDGCGVLQVVDTLGTDEPNGVEVQVPVRSVLHFNRRARQFFSYWEPGQVWIDGEPFTDHIGTREGDLVLDPDVTLVVCEDDHRIVMGNVAYPLDANLVGRSNFSIVARVPIGAVDFTPSREALHMTKRTKDTIQTIKDFVTERFERYAHEYVEASPDHPEAFKRAQLIRSARYNMKLTYQGEAVPTNIRGNILSWRDPGFYISEYGREFAAHREDYVSFDAAKTALHVVGIPGNNLSNDTKRAIYQYRIANKIATRTILASKKPLGHPWLGDVLEVSYHTLVTSLNSKQAAAKPTGQYRVLNTLGNVERLDSLGHMGNKVQCKPVWMLTSELTLVADRMNLARFVGKGIQIVLVTKTSLKKFKREHPKMQHVTQYVMSRACCLREKITAVGLWQTGGVDYNWTHGLSQLDADLVQDAELAVLIRESGGGSRVRMRQWVTAKNLVYHFGMKIEDVRLPDKNLDNCIDQMQKRYPLARHYSADQDHLEYVNALYLYRQHQLTQPDSKKGTNQP